MDTHLVEVLHLKSSRIISNHIKSISLYNLNWFWIDVLSVWYQFQIWLLHPLTFAHNDHDKCRERFLLGIIQWIQSNKLYKSHMMKTNILSIRQIHFWMISFLFINSTISSTHDPFIYTAEKCRVWQIIYYGRTCLPPKLTLHTVSILIHSQW